MADKITQPRDRTTGGTRLELPGGERDNQGRTALHRAAIRGDTEIAVILLRGGENHTALTLDRGLTAQQLAVDNNKFETAKAIGVFVADATDAKGGEEDDEAKGGEEDDEAKGGEDSANTFLAELEAPEVNAGDDEEKAAEAETMRRKEKKKHGNELAVRSERWGLSGSLLRLVSIGKNLQPNIQVGITDEQWKTLSAEAWSAAREGSTTRLMDLDLLAHWTDSTKIKQLFNADDGYGFTPLLIACSNGNLEAVKYFLNEKRTDLSVVHYTRQSALHLSAYRGHARVVAALLLAGIDYTIVNNEGKTAAQVAESRNHRETAEVISAFITIQDEENEEEKEYSLAEWRRRWR